MKNYTIITTAALLTFAVLGVLTPVSSFAANQTINGGATTLTNAGIIQLSNTAGAYNIKNINAQGTHNLLATQAGNYQSIKHGVKVITNVDINQLAAAVASNKSDVLTLGDIIGDLNQKGDNQSIIASGNTLANLKFKQQAFNFSNNDSTVGVGSATDSTVSQTGSLQTVDHSNTSETNLTLDQYSDKNSSNLNSLSSSSNSTIDVTQSN
jgi:hypothetical protein